MSLGSQHILQPAHLGGDGDKAVCGVRISEKPGRTVVVHPRDMIDADETGCEGCYLRVLRSWQARDPNIDPVPTTWAHWPWETP